MRLTRRATELIADIRTALAPARGELESTQAVMRALHPHLTHADLLLPAQRASAPDGYQQHVLHVEPDGSFSVVSLVWLPGQCTPIHDHVSWCVVGIHRGTEEEIQYRLESASGRDHLMPQTISLSHRGTVCGLTPPGDIHAVRNATNTTTISIHVYGADISKLGTSIRRRYDQPVLTVPQQSA
jgi:predicted metal-dependent enzyme (double-stranded beta helix superfamily)